MTNKQKNGFTIVELLIVIVVIAILATISIVAYNGIQQRARDAQRKSDIATLAKKLSLYNIDNGNYAEGNCGYVGGDTTGGGWLTGDYDGAGPNVSINQCLIDAGQLVEPLGDPSGSNGCAPAPSGVIGDCHAYMKYSCTSGRTYLFANLESTPGNTTATDDTCMPDYDRSYGMDYVVEVQ